MTPDKVTISEQMVAVGGGHSLYVQMWGNPASPTTFLFLHGGPGSGCSNDDKFLFDGNRDRVIFFDQRGAGRSTPYGSLVHNTTPELVNDIQHILNVLRVKKVTIVAGSWGTCLALAYALEHPDSVEAMVLRGIFTGSHAEIDYLDKGQARALYPEAWGKFVAQTPPKYADNPMGYHAQKILGKNGTAALTSAYAYGQYVDSLSSLYPVAAVQNEPEFDAGPVKIETHYTQHGCFMSDRHIFDHAHLLTMPIWLVHGRYDLICAPAAAHELHRRLPNSTLLFTTAGHSGSEPENQQTVQAIISTVALA